MNTVVSGVRCGRGLLIHSSLYCDEWIALLSVCVCGGEGNAAVHSTGGACMTQDV